MPKVAPFPYVQYSKLSRMTYRRLHLLVMIVLLLASFYRVVFACIHWILVYFSCFVHRVNLTIYSQNTHKMRHFNMEM